MTEENIKSVNKEQPFLDVSKRGLNSTPDFYLSEYLLNVTAKTRQMLKCKQKVYIKHFCCLVEIKTDKYLNVCETCLIWTHDLSVFVFKHVFLNSGTHVLQ